MAYVLDVGLPLRLVCAIPYPHLLAIHRELDYGVVVAERLLVILCLAFKLFLQRLQGTRHHTLGNSHKLVVFRLASRLCLLDELLALEHLIVRTRNERLPQGAYPLFNLLLERSALGIVLGNVLQSPATRNGELVLQDLVYEDVGATNPTRGVHPILVELDFVRLCVRRLDELILVACSLLPLQFHHRFLHLAFLLS
ncbi:MAG: hypothetical protein IKU98_05385 [Bacteroidaceae bacterium]|nr:hypothetical protein [Bacteroidaceae bacterium]